jgi:hypothetical protein
MSDPVTVDKTVFLATDDEWSFRKLIDITPIIPTSARAQIRDTFGGTIWLDAEVDIDVSDGWITVILPKEQTTLELWAGRFTGVWDLYVTVNDETERWIMGKIEVSRNVTI